MQQRRLVPKSMYEAILPSPSRSTCIGLWLTSGASLLTAILSRVLSPDPQKGRTRIWYDALEKPSFTPPKKVFGPAWALIYASSAYAAFRVWKQASSPERSRALGAWTSHLGFNAVWSKLFFGERRAIASLADVTADLASAASFTFYASKVDRLAGALALPLVSWLALATAMNEEIVRKNRSAFKR